MGPSSTYGGDRGPSSPSPSYDPNPPTIAPFSPTTLSGSSPASRQRSTIIVHKKSPLLVATPPQVTRALAYSHPFILPLNKLVGLLSWSSGDPWESFLLVAGFWAIVLYGNEIILWAGPIMVVVGLILAMYSRRYSPLSSTAQTGEKHGHKREVSDISTRHHKSLDEIVETLREFTTRCNLLLDPFLRLTDFLSTQRTPTSATTRPALTALFIRILCLTPFWILFSLPPVRIITTPRVMLTFGTIILTWHSRPARVSRVILWRSLLVRRMCSVITGFTFSTSVDSAGVSMKDGKLAPPSDSRLRSKSQTNIASDIATKRRPDSSGVRFTFILYENQRRWLGIGWTYSLLAYERAAWTDEHLNPAPSKDEFELPDVEGGHARWRWVEGSQWRIEGGTDPKSAEDTHENDGGGWIYYDNKWNDGRRGADSWNRYTRRRKWYRDAELVEVTPSTEITPSTTPNKQSNPDRDVHSEVEDSARDLSKNPQTLDPKSNDSTSKDADSVSVTAKKHNSGWFGRKRGDSRSSGKSDAKGSIESATSATSAKTDPGEDHLDRWKSRDSNDERGWGLGEDAAMGLS